MLKPKNVSCREKVLLTCTYKSSSGEQVQIPDLVSSRLHSKVLANSWPELFSPSYKVFLYAVNKIHLVNVWLRRQSLDILNHWPDTYKILVITIWWQSTLYYSLKATRLDLWDKNFEGFEKLHTIGYKPRLIFTLILKEKFEKITSRCQKSLQACVWPN